MRYVLVLALGLLGGWFGHAVITRSPPPARADKAARPATPAPAATTAVADPIPLPPAPTPREEEEQVHAEEEGETATEVADPEMDRLREMVRSQSKAWKGWAGMQARQRAEALLANLPFDAEREKKIQELLQQEAELQAERAAMMMLGDEEMDPAAFQWFMGMPEELSPRLEAELATFLNDGEMQIMRAEVKRSHEKQMTDLADMQIGMMQIRDLTDDQKTRIRDVLSGKDVMTEQFTRFAEVTRDRAKFQRLLKGEGLKEEMEKGFAPTRQRMRDILTPDQFVRYQAYEQQMVRQAEMGLKMMSAFLEKPSGGTKEPASK